MLLGMKHKEFLSNEHTAKGRKHEVTERVGIGEATASRSVPTELQTAHPTSRFGSLRDYTTSVVFFAFSDHLIKLYGSHTTVNEALQFL
jgi:hypothetical protein